jgi:plasmid replication initiation protein
LPKNRSFSNYLEKEITGISIWQSNFITAARYEMTAMEKNLIYMVMAQIKKSDTPGKLYVVSATELMKHTGSHILYEDLKKATSRLRERKLDGILANGNYLGVGFIASAEYITGKGLIEIELSQKILSFYLDLKEQFTTFQLDIALSLNSVYAKRLYEMLSMFKNMKDKKFLLSITELKERLFLIDKKTGKDKYPTYTKLESNVLKPAEREINGQTDIFFTYKPIEGKKKGKGRKPIVQIEFSIIYQSKKPELGFEAHNLPLFERLTNDFKLRKDQASAVIDRYSKEDINKNLYQISIKKVNNVIKDIGAFTASVFNVKDLI